MFVRKIHVIHAELILAKGSELQQLERSEVEGTDSHVKVKPLK